MYKTVLQELKSACRSKHAQDGLLNKKWAGIKFKLI